MNNTLSLLKVHIKAQKYLYLCPLLYIYIFFLPYQHQILQSEIIDDMLMIKIYNSAQIFLLVFAIWYQYLGLRIELFHELQEISCGIYRKRKILWYIYCLLVYLIILGPYFIWLFFASCGYQEVVLVLLFQIFEISIAASFVMRLFKSALAGMVAILVYLFTSIFHLLPDSVGIIRIGLLPKYFSVEWYLIQSFIIIILFFSNLGMVKKGGCYKI